MNVRQVTRVVLSSGLVALAGCATTGGSQIESSIYDTHRMVKGLDTNLQPSIERLNQTAAGLDARVTSTDEQTRRLQGLVEENQVRLDDLQRKLDEVRQMVARATGSSVSPAPPPPAVSGSGPQEEFSMRGGTTAPPAAGGVTPLPPEAAPPIASVPEPTGTLDPMPSQALSGGNATADYEKAITAYRNENYREAIQQFDDYMKRYPDNQYCANSQYWKAYSYAKLKEFEPAIREFEKMRALYPNDQKIPLAMYNQAAAHSNLGQIAETKALLQRLIAQYPDDAAAQAARGDLAKLEG